MLVCSRKHFIECVESKVEIPSEPEPEVPRMGSDSAMFRTPVRGGAGLDSTLGASCVQSPLNYQRRYDLTYRGNPDIRPICSYEVAFLVRLFHQICSNINDKVPTCSLQFIKCP